MRKPWPFALAVIVIGGLAGVAIAGRPAPIDPFVLAAGTTAAGSTSTSVSPGTSSSAAPTTTTVEASTTVPAATSVAPTVAPVTAAPTTSEATTTTETATTTGAPTIPGPLPRDQVRLVIANGDGRFRLASITADRVRPLGYVISLGDALSKVDATVIYYRPGFDDEAAFAAIDIDIPDAVILAFPTSAPQAVTDIDASGDVIIVLGPDAPR